MRHARRRHVAAVLKSAARATTGAALSCVTRTRRDGSRVAGPRVARCAGAGLAAREPAAYAVRMAHQHRPGDVSDKAVIELGPIAARLREDLDVEEREWQLVVRAMTQALMAGVRIGGAEVAAQAIESGMPVTLNMHVETTDRDEE
ncbi:MAG: hypothetical protein QOJ46_395 [bacterium]